jgi:hypothetical protein
MNNRSCFRRSAHKSARLDFGAYQGSYDRPNLRLISHGHSVMARAGWSEPPLAALIGKLTNEDIAMDHRDAAASAIRISPCWMPRSVSASPLTRTGYLCGRRKSSTCERSIGPSRLSDAGERTRSYYLHCNQPLTIAFLRFWMIPMFKLAVLSPGT